MSNSHSALTLITTHLNVPYGPVVTDQQLADVLRSAELSCVGNDLAAAVLASMSLECSQRSVLAACAEVGGDTKSLAQLYERCVAAGQPRVPAWDVYFQEAM